MPTTMKPFVPIRSTRRPVRVTGRKYAVASRMPVPAAPGLEPRGRVRPLVAALSSEGTSPELFDVSTAFLESPLDLHGVPFAQAELPAVLHQLLKRLQDHGISQIARPLPIQRLRSPEPPEHHGYPLHRTQYVIFNREAGRVTAQLKELSRVLGLPGIGTDEDQALRDLERQFDQVVREKVRVPPHARRASDEPVRAVVNHLVNWEQFERENPTPHLLWGRIVRRGRSPRPSVYWLVGPDGLREQTGALPRRLTSPYFLALKNGDWFQAVVLEFPDRIEWVEPPAPSSDPTDPAVRRAMWEAIPRILADSPDVWPLKKR